MRRGTGTRPRRARPRKPPARRQRALRDACSSVACVLAICRLRDSRMPLACDMMSVRQPCTLPCCCHWVPSEQGSTNQAQLCCRQRHSQDLRTLLRTDRNSSAGARRRAYRHCRDPRCKYQQASQRGERLRARSALAYSTLNPKRDVLRDDVRRNLLNQNSPACVTGRSVTPPAARAGERTPLLVADRPCPLLLGRVHLFTS